MKLMKVKNKIYIFGELSAINSDIVFLTELDKLAEIRKEIIRLNPRKIHYIPDLYSSNIVQTKLDVMKLKVITDKLNHRCIIYIHLVGSDKDFFNILKEYFVDNYNDIKIIKDKSIQIPGGMRRYALSSSYLALVINDMGAYRYITNIINNGYYSSIRTDKYKFNLSKYNTIFRMRDLR